MKFQARLNISSEPPRKPLFLWGEFCRLRLKISSEIEHSSEIAFASRFGPLRKSLEKKGKTLKKTRGKKQGIPNNKERKDKVGNLLDPAGQKLTN